MRLLRMVVTILLLGTIAISAQETIQLSKGTVVNVRTVPAVIANAWQLTVDPSGYLWCTDHNNGRVVRVHPGLGWSDVVLDLPLTVNSDDATIAGGLFGIAVHPDIDNGTPYVFVTYTSADDRLTVARYRYNGRQLVDPKVLLVVNNVPHNLGQTITVLSDNTILVSVGSFDTPAPTELSSLNGKLIRMTLDGNAALDNPFYKWDNPTALAGYIYSYGHRNVSGITQLPATHATRPGAIYAVEAGPVANDEINNIEPGKDYGWRKISGYCQTGTDAIQCPLSTYFQAPSQAAFYSSKAIPEWTNSLLIGTLYGNGLMVAALDGSGKISNSDPSQSSENTMALDADHLIPFTNDSFLERIRSVAVSYDGRVYMIVTSGVDKPNTRILALENPLAHSPLAVSEDIVAGNGFTFGPNPAREQVTLQLNAALPSEWTLELLDVMGRSIEIQRHEQYEISAVLNTAALSSGAYLIVVSSQNGKLRSTLIK
ncbi:MAG: PQQ-dependent sugar dehydrogenase [Ignavibacteria bacterium]|nr:PQQ-dependent sugar dehydrogenase [Ignavibacteria bacterium]